MNKVGADARNLTTSPRRIERIVGRFQVLGDPERVPVQQLAESQELDKRTRGGFDRLGPGLPRPFEGEDQRRTREPGKPASGPAGASGCHCQLTSQRRWPKLSRSRRARRSSTESTIQETGVRKRRDCSKPLRRRRVTRTRCQRPSGSGKCLSPSVNTMQTPDQWSSNSLVIRNDLTFHLTLS